MKKDTKTRILEGAFRLFLQSHYETVTVVDIERATGITRGSIFYYYANKEDLFRTVIDTYIIKLHLLNNNEKNPLKDVTLKKYIYHHIEGVDAILKLGETVGVENIQKAFFSLIFQALHHYKDIEERLGNELEFELGLWENIVQLAYDTKEIKQTVNVKDTAAIFRYIHLGLSLHSVPKKGIYAQRLLELYMSYYDLIKTEGE